MLAFLSLQAALPTEALAQKNGKSSTGVGFVMGTRFWAPSDPRVDAGSNVIRIHFQGQGDEYFFHEKEDGTLTFQNTGPGAVIVTGSVSVQGIGFGMLMSKALRFEMMAGRASTFINNGVVISSDSIFNLALFYSYRQSSGAFLDLGMLYRHHRLSNTLPGNVIDMTGTSSAEPLDDLGGVILNIGIGYGF
ncbi:MAG: hypothetical protein OEZ59_01255 [Deltaproteobacteria bacterium]|nr:hypothetical protein [Deltaproteobacteria bacterium]